MPINHPSDWFWVVPVFPPISFVNPYLYLSLTPVPDRFLAVGLYTPSTTPCKSLTITSAVFSLIASLDFGINLSNTTPFLSSIFVTKIGSTQTPLFEKVEYAPTIS